MAGWGGSLGGAEHIYIYYYIILYYIILYYIILYYCIYIYMYHYVPIFCSNDPNWSQMIPDSLLSWPLWALSKSFWAFLSWAMRSRTTFKCSAKEHQMDVGVRFIVSCAYEPKRCQKYSKVIKPAARSLQKSVLFKSSAILVLSYVHIIICSYMFTF